MESETVLLWLKQCEEQELKRQVERSRELRRLRSTQILPPQILETQREVHILYNTFFTYAQKVIRRLKSTKFVKATERTS